MDECCVSMYVCMFVCLCILSRYVRVYVFVYVCRNVYVCIGAHIFLPSVAKPCVAGSREAPDGRLNNALEPPPLLVSQGGWRGAGRGSS